MENKNTNFFIKLLLSIKNTFIWLFDINDWKKVLRAVPGLVLSIFFLSIVLMNLLVGKVIITTPYFGITGGLFLSWIPLMCLDMIVKTFGAKAANKVNILGAVINFLCIGLFHIVVKIEIGCEPGIYDEFNNVFAQTWQIFLASNIAFVISGIINNLINVSIGKTFKKNPDGKLAYVVRSYVSTFIGQFIDNFIFYFLAFLVFFKYSIGSTMGYTVISILGTAVLEGLLEFGLEAIFAPLGYRVSKKWQDEGLADNLK